MVNILFYLFVFFLPFLNVLTLETGGTLKISDILALLLIGGGIGYFVICRFKDKPVKIYFSKFSLPLVLFVFACLVSVIQTKRVPITEFSLNEAVGRNTYQLRSITTFAWALFSYLVFLLVINIVKNKEMLLKVLKVYVISSFIVCAYGLYQLFGHLLGLKTGLVFTEEIWLIPRINATLNEPIIFANYLISAIGLSLALFLSKEKIPNRYLLGVILLVQITSIILTFSLSGLIALVVSVIFLFVINRRYLIKRKQVAYLILAAFFLVYISFMLMPSPISNVVKVSIDKLRNFDMYSRMSIEALRADPSGYSQQDRFWHWGAAINMFKSHPVLGVGTGNFGFHYNAYRPRGAEYKDYLTLPNNQYLEVLAETGIFGMICFLYVIFSFLRLIVMGLRRTSDYALRLILGALGAVFIGWMIQYSFFSTLYIIYIWALLGITVATARLAANDEKCALP